MSRKVWYDIKAPAPFTTAPIVCKTFVNKTVGTKTDEDNLKGRIFEASIGDLMNDENEGHQVVKLKVSDIKDKVGYTAFQGLRFTTDKLKSLVKKWHTQITAQTTVSTTDGYILRVFAIGYTRRRQLQKKKTAYAMKSQVKKISAKMKDIITTTGSSCSIKEFCNQLMLNMIGTQIAKQCAGIFPLQTTHIYKVKVLKAPKQSIEALTSEIDTTKQSGEKGKKVKA
jgi:small subunit ribosomal protein S3Ae